MQQTELEPQKARSGIVSGRIVTVLTISLTCAILALAAAWMVFAGR